MPPKQDRAFVRLPSPAMQRGATPCGIDPDAVWAGLPPTGRPKKRDVAMAVFGRSAFQVVFAVRCAVSLSVFMLEERAYLRWHDGCRGTRLVPALCRDGRRFGQRFRGMNAQR